MRQAVHIFKKDARYLRWELAVSLVLLVTFIYTQIFHDVMIYNRTTAIPLLLTGFWAFLCARLIQAEAIPGDRQFWITRPYEWGSLLGAKLLFVVCFLAVPLLLADAVILSVKGFPVGALAGALLWSMTLITGGLFLALCAFATLTRGLAAWMLGAVAVVGTLYALDAVAGGKFWAGVEWMRDYGGAAILFVTAIVVLLWQYKRRGTLASVMVMGVGWVGSSVFVHYARSAWALELESRFSKPIVDPSSIQIAVRAPRERATAQPLGRQQVIVLAIPVDISGLKAGENLISDEVLVSIKNQSGETFRIEGLRQNYLRHTTGGYDLRLWVDRTVFEKASAGPVSMDVTLYLTLLRDAASMEIPPGGTVDVPGAGRCKDLILDRDSWIVCESPLRTPSNVLVVKGGGGRDRFLSETSYSPFPADADSAIVPLGRYSHSGPSDFSRATLTSLEPVAHFRRDLDLPRVYLADYQVASPF